MHLLIHHSTHYTYDAALRLSTQVLRLTPRPSPGTRVAHWRLDLPGQAVAFADAWGNPAHLLSLEGPRRDIVLRADGEVSTADGPAQPEPDHDLPPEVFLRGTQHPRWTRGAWNPDAEGAGLQILRNGVLAAS